MERITAKQGRCSSPISLLSLALMRFSGGMLPLQMVMIQQELSLSYRILAWLLLAEFVGLVLGSCWVAYTHVNLIQWWLLFLGGNLLTGLARRAVGMLLARLLIGAGRFQIESAAFTDTVGKNLPQMVAKLAEYRLVSVISTVVAPVLGAVLLVRRGVRDTAYIMAVIAFVFLLFIPLLSQKVRKTQPIWRDIACKGFNPDGLLWPLSLLVLFFYGIGIVAVAVIGISFLALSGDLLLSGAIMSILQLCLLFCQAAFSLYSNKKHPV